MPTTLPDGYTWRRATTADAEPIFALMSTHNAEVLGYGDVTLSDVQDDLIEPGFDIATDSWLGFAPDGSLAGFAWAFGKGSGEEVDADVITHDDALAAWMYEQILARAAEVARAGGHARCAVDMGIYRDDARGREAAREHGFAPATR